MTVEEETPRPGVAGRHRLVAAAARAHPDLIAIRSEDETVTYAELETRVNRLTHALHARGVGPGAAVAICLPRGPDLIVAMLAVLRTGACYVPLDPTGPPARAALILADTAAALAIATEASSSPLPRRWPRLQLDDDPDPTAGFPSHPPEVPASDPTAPDRGGRIGHILYTSGSTGRPKGVRVTERGVVTLLRALGEYVTVGPGESVLFTTVETFDISVVEIFLPLLHGGQVVIVGRDAARSPAEFAALVDRHDARLAQATPSAWRTLLAGLEAGGHRERLQVISAGEPLPADLADGLRRVAGTVLNGYGPTETTIYSTMIRVDSSTMTRDDGAGSVPIGRPLDGTVLRLVDRENGPVRDGEVGEILIGGPGIADGYINLPELTEQLFVPDPAGDAGIVYRTGDLARRRPDGTLEYLGRTDRQLKIRGHRVEPEEVEGRLAAHPEVSACVVRGYDFAPDDARLVAYLVPATATLPTPAALRAWCAESLPEAFIPARYLAIDAIPLTPHGKLDAAALPNPTAVPSHPVRENDTAQDGGGAAQAAVVGIEPPASEAAGRPRTPAERTVARVWAQALWLDEVGIDDDFFDLGGDSLVATRVLLRLEEEFLLAIPIRAIFVHRTAGDLAAALTRARRAGRFDLPDGMPAAMGGAA
ncbi:amino acid adenylation domain-containing protein [Frankia gtarii]|uniref:amino acid adenylation domain-containing protein n=1 Tax=Frankia gtarii TaxID=2950102 RepID=UPI0021C220FA|nr:amino acid adenylation domain-containing protein [Frankia gtarii]